MSHMYSSHPFTPQKVQQFPGTFSLDLAERIAEPGAIRQTVSRGFDAVNALLLPGQLGFRLNDMLRQTESGRC